MPDHFCIGEYGIFFQSSYFETIRAITDVKVLAINLTQLNSLFQRYPDLQVKIMNSFIDQTYGVKKNHYEVSKNALKSVFAEANSRLKISIFIVYSLILLAIYNLAVEFITYFKHSVTYSTFVSGGVLLLFAACFFVMILHMRIPLAEFGFNLRNWKKNLIESLLWTFYFCVGSLLLKLWLTKNVFIFSHIPFLFHKEKYGMNSIWFALAYAFFAPIQEFFIRGAIQSSLLKLLKIRQAIFFSVIISTLIFAAVHIDLHFFFAIAVIPPSIMWSIMYARQRSLLGVSISHALIGIWAFWFLGIAQFISILNEKYAHIIYA